jgi:catechol 2,3-dioxygenase-like lactoylglutathione lyase family enzyme
VDAPSFDHLLIAAPPGCEAQARWFFGGLLGLREIPKPRALQARGGVWFALGDHQLHVGVEEAFVPARKAHPAIRLDPSAIDGVAGVLEDAGVAVEWDDSLSGARRLYTADPWGNRIELVARR